MKVQLKEKGCHGPKNQDHPFIFCRQGMYHAYVEGKEGIYCYRSVVLLGDYYYQKCVFQLRGYRRLHSPCVVYFNQMMYLFVAGYKIGEEEKGSEIIVASSENPVKSYTFLKILRKGDHPSVHLTKEGGYLYFNLPDEKDANSVSIYVQKLSNILNLEGEAKCVCRGSGNQEQFDANDLSKGFRLLHPHYFSLYGYHFLFFTVMHEDQSSYIHYRVVRDLKNELMGISFLPEKDDIPYTPFLPSNPYERDYQRLSVAARGDMDFYVFYAAKENGEDIHTMHVAKMFVRLNQVAAYIGKRPI